MFEELVPKKVGVIEKSELELLPDPETIFRHLRDYHSSHESRLENANELYSYRQTYGGDRIRVVSGMFRRIDHSNSYKLRNYEILEYANKAAQNAGLDEEEKQEFVDAIVFFGSEFESIIKRFDDKDSETPIIPNGETDEQALSGVLIAAKAMDFNFSLHCREKIILVTPESNLEDLISEVES